MQQNNYYVGDENCAQIINAFILFSKIVAQQSSVCHFGKVYDMSSYRHVFICINLLPYIR